MLRKRFLTNIMMGLSCCGPCGVIYGLNSKLPRWDPAPKDESASHGLLCTCRGLFLQSGSFGDREGGGTEVQEEQTVLSQGCNDPLPVTLNQAVKDG